MVHPSPSPLLFLPRTTFEHIALLRQLFISLSSPSHSHSLPPPLTNPPAPHPVALSQLLPLFSPPPPPDHLSPQVRARTDAEQLWPFVERLGQLRSLAENELNTMIALEVRPLLADARTTHDDGAARVGSMKRGMRDSFLDLRVKSTDEGKQAWASAVRDGVERTGRRRPPSSSGKGLVDAPGRLPSPPPE